MEQLILEQEEMQFYETVEDVIDAFKTHGVKIVLDEVNKDPKLMNQLFEYFESLNFEV